MSGYREYATIIVGVLCFVAGAGVSYALTALVTPEDVLPPLRAGKGDYAYINPLLACRSTASGPSSNLSPLKQEIMRITARAQADKIIVSGSVYFRDLTNGQWTGLNEETQYAPASLIKVPILIAYLKAAETNPSLLQKSAFYQQEPGQEPPLIENPTLRSGHSYSVEELLRGMIIDSDNSAKNMLEGGIDKDFLQEVYAELGISSPYDDPSSYQISTRTYSLFFRVLYNASFLNREMSEKALAILAEVKFDKGLRAGTPSEVPIANKYGYSIIKEGPPHIIDLSDCGIVYDTEKPYLLCVMAEGVDPELTATYIRDIALAVNHFMTDE